MAAIIIDDREKDIINVVVPFLLSFNTLKKINISHEVKRISIGDFLIMINGVVKMIIERKTWKDFAASIIDNRFDEQKKCMLEYRDECCDEKPDILYIIEGNNPSFIKEGQQIGRMNAQCILGKMRKMLIRDKISHIRTKNFEDTSSWIVNMAYDYCLLFPEVLQNSLDGNNNNIPNKFILPKHKTEYQIRLGMWKQLPSVGNVLSVYLVKEINIGDLVIGRITINNLKELKIGEKKLGENKAKKILSFDENHEKKLLLQVPNIGKKKINIIKTKRLRELLLLSQGELAKSEISKGLYLGNRCAKNILFYFQQ
jgi:ERCC4-type nuclease